MITTLNDFTEVIEGNYKIKDIPTYVEYKRARYDRNGGVPQSEIELLSPDAISSASFWEWIEKNPQLAKDAIGFNATPDVPISEINRKNFGLEMNVMFDVNPKKCILIICSNTKTTMCQKVTL